MNDRIKLAEAMGWTGIWENAPGKFMGMSPSEEGDAINYPLPDPYTDANDDHAVLHHMKEKCGIGSDCPDWQMWDSFAEEVPAAVENREIGDYARAAVLALHMSCDKDGKGV